MIESLLHLPELKEMLGPSFAVAADIPRLVNEELFPDERLYIAGAVEKRQAEFGTARICARRALAQLGVSPCSLVPHIDRSPSWPRGIVGSIAHTEGFCVAAVTNATEVAGFGVDVEQDRPLAPELEPLICTNTERLWIARQSPEMQRSLGMMFFSAKEAFYKCQYATTKAFLDFQEVELNINLGDRSFSVAHIGRGGPEWTSVRLIKGKFGHLSGLIFTAAILASEAVNCL